MDVFSLAFSGNEPALRGMLLATGISANSVSPGRRHTLLYTASRAGHLAIVRMLVEEFHANVNATNESDDGSTALHGACYGGHHAIVAYLVGRGAAPDAVNTYKETPRHNAKRPAPDVSKVDSKLCLDALSATPIAAIPAAAVATVVSAAPTIAMTSPPAVGVAAAAASPTKVPPLGGVGLGVGAGPEAIAPTAEATAKLEKLKKMSLAELRAAAVAAGVPTSGTKDALIHRLVGVPEATAVAAPAVALEPAMPIPSPLKAHKTEQGPPAAADSSTAPAASPAPVMTAPDAVDDALSPTWIGALSHATFTKVEIPKDTEEFWNLEERVMACNQKNNEDYVTNRLKKKKKPLIFIVKRAWKVVNPTLEAAFQKTQEKMSQLEDKSLSRVRVAFHGTREANIDSILKTSLLRFQHPLNPCKEQADDGYFGTNKKGVYVSRYYEYTLKYSNNLTPLDEGQTAKVIMFKCLPGKSKHIEKLNMGMDPTPGFHSHSSPSYLEWYLFDERQLCPEFVVELQANVDSRMGADDE